MQRLRLTSQSEATSRKRNVVNGEKTANGSTKRGGRPLGSINRLSRAQREAYEASGELPLDFLLRVMRTGDIGDGRHRVKQKATPDQRMEAARAAAPYLHPKLHAVHVDGKPTAMPFDLTRLQGIPQDKLVIANEVLAVLFGGQVQGPILNMQQSDITPNLYEQSLGK